MRKDSNWLFYIERLKGLAILLVVWAHVYDADFPRSALDLRTYIYAFHMPLFLFMSGYVFIHVRAHVLKGGVWAYVSKRFRRILIPFFVLAIAVIMGKAVFQQIIEVRSPVAGVWQPIRSLFVHTEDSPVFFIWYLAVLFYFNIFTMLAVSKLRIGLLILFVISLLFYCVHIYIFSNKIRLDYFYVNRVLMFYAFFIAGCMAREWNDQWLPFVDRFWIPLIAVFILLSYLFKGNEWRYLVVGMASTPVFMGLARSKLLENDRFFLFLGGWSFAIYLLNMPFVGLTQGVLGSFLSPADQGYLVIVVACIAGVIGPISLKWVFQQFRLSRPVARAME